MLSVKLFVVNALIENLVDLLTYADHPLYADVYLDMLEHLTHLRRALLARLGLPPRLSKKELLQVLNTLYTWESLEAQIKAME